MEKVCMITLLAICGWTDIRTGKLPAWVLALFGGIGILFYLRFQSVPPGQEVAGIFIGVALLLTGRVTRESVGFGDGLLLMVTGCYLGLFRNFQLLMGGLMLAALWSMALVIGRKADKKQTIPFVPFLFLTYLGMAIL